MLDAQPAMRAGFEAIVSAEPDLTLIGSVAAEAELWQLLDGARPDVVILGLDHEQLDLCCAITRRPSPPAAVLYTASVDDGLVVAAALAGAGAFVSKSSPAAELVEAIRMVASTPGGVAAIPARVRRGAAARLDPADYPIVAMRLAGEPTTEIGKTLGLSSLAIEKRITRILARLEPIQSVG